MSADDANGHDVDALEREWRSDYELVLFNGRSDLAPGMLAHLRRVEAAAALGRAKLLHACYITDGRERAEVHGLLRSAVAAYSEVGDHRGEGEATLWLGIHAQVVLDDDEAAEALLKRALALSRRANDPLNESYAERHLGYVEQSAGRLDAALARFNRSLVLRRSLDFPAGIAAALLALAELHLARGDLETVDTLLSEATDVAIACGATSVVGWTAATRAELVKVMAMDQADS